MDNAGFAVSRWDHWLLVVSAVSVASYGLWLSWQWRVARYPQRMRSRHSGPYSHSYKSRSYQTRSYQTRSYIGRTSPSSPGQASRQISRQASRQTSRQESRQVRHTTPRTHIVRQLERHLHAQQQNHHEP